MVKSKTLSGQDIDKEILSELMKNLEIKRDNVDIIDSKQIDLIFERIEEKKKIIYTLFKGDFSENERNIQKRMHTHKCTELSFYDKVANNVISKRVKAIIESIICREPKDQSREEMYLSRSSFIESILQNNMSIDFVQNCINESMEGFDIV